MISQSVYFRAGIWITLAVVSMLYCLCSLERDTGFAFGMSSRDSYFDERQIQMLQLDETLPVQRESLEKLQEKSDFEDNFGKYPTEILAAIEGTYFTGLNLGLEKSTGEKFVTEVILNTDNSRVFLPGVVYVDDRAAKDKNTVSERDTNNKARLSDVEETVQHPCAAANYALSRLQPEDLSSQIPTLSASDTDEQFDRTSRRLESSERIGKDVLIVLTTCGHLDVTVLAMEHLVRSVDIADILIVDDYSLDGTADYLRKKGFFVISKQKPMGLTDSWNKGYEFAVSTGYKYIIFANNDILVPYGAIHALRRDLLNEVLVVPLTTLKGAGHNPGQSLVRALELSVDIEDYVDNPNNVQLIQDVLTKSTKETANSSALSSIKRAMKPTHEPYASMDAAQLSGANHLLNSVWKNKARFNGFLFAVNISGIQPAAFKYPTILFDPSGLIIGQEDKLIADMEKLEMMPKISLGAYVYHFKSVTVKMSRNAKNEDSRDDLSKYHAGMTKNKKILATNGVIYPSFYSKYKDVFVEKPFSRLSVYPPLDVYDKNSQNGLYATDKQQKQQGRMTVIAFAISDAVRYPLAGDIFTATELGTALELEYENVRVIYLSKGIDWYDPARLQEVDVLVALLDDYDVTKALRSHQHRDFMAGPKPTLVTIGWARNWFPRWLKQPWVGNFDLLFSSSTLAKDFYIDFGARYGHAVDCIHGCPTERSPELSCTIMTDPTPTGVKKQQHDATGNSMDNLVTSTASSGKTVNSVQRIFPAAEKVPLSCVIFLPARNRFGGDESKTIRFEYLQGVGTKGSLVRPVMEAAGTVDNKKKKTSKRRILATFRSKVPVKILQIATNIDKFKSMSNDNRRGFMVSTQEGRVLHGEGSEADWFGEDTPKAEIGSNSAEKNRFLQSKEKVTTHGKKKEILDSADYAFTGSYYNTHRNIMNFDPIDLMPKYKGVIIGKGWDTAPNISDEFRRIAVGSIPYQHLPKIYQRVKIVVDDANHVTAPWGSVNSRVFDALSSGALVITNGVLGSKGTFGGKLPTYSTASELSALLKHFLSNDAARKNLTQELSMFVRKEHSYSKRAEEFSTALDDFGFSLKKKSKNDKSQNSVIKLKSRKKSVRHESIPRTQSAGQVRVGAAPRRAICIGVRTYESHKAWLEVLLRSLVAQHAKSPMGDSLDLQIFISDTERNSVFLPGSSAKSTRFTFSHALEEIVNRVNKDLNPGRSSQAHVVWDVNSPKRTFRNPFYGYDETDSLVGFMANLPQCEWMMMTNGDNSYNSAWFNAVAPLANDPTVELIGWDFITHHKRNGDGQQHIRISMTRGFVDLASVLVRTSKIVESKGKYLPDAMLTKDLFARDFYFLTGVLELIAPSAICLLHRVFLLHQ